MKIATRLMLSYLVIILMTTLGMVFLADKVLDRLMSENLETASKAVSALAKADNDLSETILTRFGEKLVEVQGHQAAALLSLELSKRNPQDYGELRKDKELRKIAAQNIYTPEGENIAGHIDVFDNKGVAVWHLNSSVEGRNYSEWKDEFPDMWELVQRSFTEDRVQGYYTFIDRNQKAAKKFMALMHVQGTPFVVSAVVEIDKYFLPVQEKIRDADNKAEQQARASIVKSTGSTLDHAKFLSLGGSLILLALAGFFGFWFTGSISRPIMGLRDAVKKIGEGDFQVQVSERGPEEVKQLAQSFNLLGRQLTQYVNRLAEETAAKQRMESELSIAAEIQRSLLPTSFSPPEGGDRLEIYAVMEPARNVGGDFYDFFSIDEENMCFAIGDVCGKGVPAAILMAVTKSLLETAAGENSNPGHVLARVNRRLSQNNESCVFVTIFCCVLNFKEGKFIYANGGHDSPLVIGQQESIAFLDHPGGPALGLFQDAVFPTQEFIMEPGDTLLAFTDGVTEAFDRTGRFFAKENLIKQARRLTDRSVRDVVKDLFKEVVSFSDGMSQADDITILAFRLNKKV
ncbi:MAG: SpoIIE family protein phosphatase [Desulfomonile sp.]